eukprot:scaffold154279_cov36-Cyclotella_meneghiniana.AAC.5
MQAIANCKAAIKGLNGDKHDIQMQELQQILDNAESKLGNVNQVPRVQTESTNQQLPRVQVITTATA